MVIVTKFFYIVYVTEVSQKGQTYRHVRRMVHNLVSKFFHHKEPEETANHTVRNELIWRCLENKSWMFASV